MSSPVKPAVVQQATPSDSTQRIATKSRIGVASLIGTALALGAGAAATYYVGGIEEVTKKIRSAIQDLGFTVPSLASLKGHAGAAFDHIIDNMTGYGAITAFGSAVAGTGATIGAGIGKLTAHKASLNDIKAQLGVVGSDLNFSQIRRVANIAVQGGIFTNRSTVAQPKDDASRIKNLNRVLTNTEFSLSSNAHNTSKARGAEDRFFDFEGGRLASHSESTSDFVEALQALKSAVHNEVKATDKYTYQIGNSAAAVNRREYILAGIMGFAYERGIAGNYLESALKERSEKAKTNSKLADANFKQSLQNGIVSGILDPANDSKAYEGMVRAAASASKASAGKNPDSVISSVFDSLKEAGLVDGNLRARFSKDVREKLSHPEAEFTNPKEPKGKEASFRERLFGKNNPAVLLKEGVQLDAKAEAAASESSSSLSVDGEDSLGGEAVKESRSQMKKRLAAEEQAKADVEVNAYADDLGKLDPRLNELADLYRKLIDLLNQKSIPLDQIMNMGTRRLRGVLALRHKEGFDLFERYEANDAAIQSTREKIAALTGQIEAGKVARPEEFKRASKTQRRAAESLEKQIKAAEASIANLSKNVAAIDAKIDSVEAILGDNEDRASTFLFPTTEATLPEPTEPKAPGFFEKLFSKQQKPVVENLIEGEVQVEGAVEKETAVVEEQTIDAPVENDSSASTLKTGEEVLPEPVIVQKPRWKVWA